MMKRTLGRVLAVFMALLVSVNTVDLHVLAEELRITELSQEGSADDERMVVSENATQDRGSEAELASWDAEDEGSLGGGAYNGWDGITTEAVYEAEGYIVTFSLNGYWENGYNAKIRIENTGEGIIENWRLGFDFHNTISNIWNACVQEEKDGKYLIKNAGWNQDIAAGESVEFGFGGQEAFAGFPETYCLQGDIIQTDYESYSITYCLDNDWGSGFTGTVTITNNTRETIEDWTLEFDFNGEVISSWGGNIISHDEKHYIIRNAGYNANIAAEGSVSFGFSGTYEEFNTPPDHFVLFSSGAIMTEEKEEDDWIVSNALSWLNVEYAFGDTQDSVTSNVTLCKSLYDAKVEWTSSNPNLISNSGVVTRPTGASEHVTLTAQVSSNDYSDVKEFDLYVIKDDYVDYNLDYIEDLDSLELLYLYNDGDPEDLKVYLNDEGYISFISGSFSDFVVESPEEAVLALYGIKSLAGIESPKDELRWLSTSKDAYGTFFWFRQVYNGIPVYGMDIVVAVDTMGKTFALHSSYIADIRIDANPSVSEASAMDILSGQGYSCLEDSDLTIFLHDGEPKLAWSVRAMYEGEFYTVLLDAHNGEILFTNCLNHYETMGKANASGASWLDSEGELEFAVTYVTAGNVTEYSLRDPDRHILVYDNKGVDPNIVLEKLIRKKNNVWTAGEVSAITNVAKAYDFYYNNYGHKGLDGNGSPVDVWINWEKADSCSLSDSWGLVFGYGGDYLYGAEAALDTVGHEYTHSVIRAKTSLADYYCNATGAISEGYADIFGYFIEGDDDPKWLHREDNTREYEDDPNKKGIRNMSNPAQFGDPSRIGDKYYYDFTVKGSGDDNGRIHHNCLIVSHACYLMWKNGITDKQRLADLWYHSLLLGYNGRSTFYTVRQNVLTAATNMKMSDDEMLVIKAAFDEVGIEESARADIRGTNIVTGKVVVADEDMALGNNQALPGVTIELARVSAINDGGSYANRIAFSEKDGVFSIANVLPGNYKLTISKADYYLTTLYITVSSTKLNNYCNTVELIPMSYAGKGTARGRIVDSVTGKGVEGLTLRIRKGINAKSGTVIRESSSGLNGVYSLEDLESGHYCAEIIDWRNVEENKYLTTYFNVKVLGGKVIANQNATVSTSLDAGQLRIVLEWGEKPGDLDSHLLGPRSSGGQFHIWYIGKQYSENGVKMAELDLDDRGGYGPETTTIYNEREGVYTFYVYNFTGTPAISTSGASVRVYTGNSNEPAYVFNIPVDGVGRYWTVFTYHAGTRKITPINAVGTYVAN